MATLAVPPREPVAAAVAHSSSKAEWLEESQASIDAYLGAGERMAMIMGIVGIVGMALIALVVVAWAIGVLPVAVKLIR